MLGYHFAGKREGTEKGRRKLIAEEDNSLACRVKVLGNVDSKRRLTPGKWA
jgi:hypothetical protein